MDHDDTRFRLDGLADELLDYDSRGIVRFRGSSSMDTSKASGGEWKEGGLIHLTCT